MCRLCVMRCGVRATVEGDRLVKVEGAPGSAMGGFICMHGQALPQIVHASERLRAPLRRRGSEFEEVSWEEALEEIAARLKAVAVRHGARAVAVQTGWPFVRHPMVGVLQRFCQAFGTPNLATVASVCEASGRMGKALTCGSKYWADVNRSRTLFVWGANPSISAPPYARLVEAMGRPGRGLVVIDPVRTPLAERAGLFLQVRPGTDAALALGMMRVIVQEGWFDRGYVARYTVGFEALSAHLEAWDLARTSEVTSVPGAQIREAARQMAQAGPVSVWDGLGLEHHENGVQAVRAVACLQALCGWLDVPGGGVLFSKAGAGFDGEVLPALYRMQTPEPVPPPVEEAPIGHAAHPLYTVFNRQAQGACFARAILEDAPYPLRALVLVGSNALITSPGASRLRAAADKLELLVVVDPVLSASGELADFVLPAASFVEGAAPPEGVEAVGRSPMIPPLYGSRTEYAIFAGLAAQLGLGRYFPWESHEGMAAAAWVPFMRDASLELRPSRPESERGGAPRFPSSSGRIEFSSGLLGARGYDALPTWRAASAAPDGEFPLRLVTGSRTLSYINSQFHHVDGVARRGPRPIARMHPEAAQAAGVVDGGRVMIRSPHGSVEMVVEVTEAVHPEVVVVPAGWASANANALIPDGVRDPISGFPAFRSGVCAVSPSGGGQGSE